MSGISPIPQFKSRDARDAIRAAVAKERERCALIAETTPIKGSEPRSILADVVARIRGGK